jgi:hypothetical protein
MNMKMHPSATVYPEATSLPQRRVVTPHWSLGRQPVPAAELPATPSNSTANQTNRPMRRTNEKFEGMQSAHSSRNWLDNDPTTWPGRKVRNRRTGVVLTIKNVFRNGRVELERSWMIYSSDIHSIRATYETSV